MDNAVTLAAGLIKEYEGCRLRAYLCPAGVPTIGWGATGPDIRLGMKWTQAKADARLAQDIARTMAQVTALVTVPLDDHQRAALTSFAYNVGIGSLKGSTLLRKLNSGDHHGAAGEFAKWSKATVNGRKVTLAGLVRRRAAEAAMFLVGDGQPDTMVQAVEAASAMKPVHQSVTVQSGVAGLGLAGGLAAAVPVIEQARETATAVQGLLAVLPPGGSVWLVVGVLAVTVGIMIWRRIGDARKTAT